MTKNDTTPMQHVERLCVDIGPRPIGSPNAQRAADYLRSVFQAEGYEVEEQDFACRGWEHRRTLLQLDTELQASANPFSPACDVAAQVVPVGTLGELEAADIRGKIGLLYGDLSNNPLSAKSWFLISERDKRIIQLLEENKPAALLTVEPMTTEYEQGIEDWELAIPSATVPPAAGLALLMTAGAMAHLLIDSELRDARAANIVARKRVSGASKIVVCAHYDTKMDTPGAVDNGAGVAVVLALAQALSRSSLAHDLELIAFTGEEYLPLGDDEYLRRCGTELDRIIAAINLDGVGSYLAATSIMLASGSAALQEHLTEMTRRYPGVVWVEPWPESNHSTFSFRGVPSVALSGVGSRRIAHRPGDTAAGISPAKLNEALELVTDIVMGLQSRNTVWTREGKT